MFNRKLFKVLPLLLVLVFAASTVYGAATLFPDPKFTVIDSNGDPLSGGKVYFFETGTATPKTTWINAAKGTPNANPVILDSNGQANIWIDSTDGQYRVRVDTSADVTQWGPIDNVDSLVTANVGGDTIFLLEHTSAGRHLDPDSSSYTDFATAVSTIGATETSLIISTSEAVTGNVTVPATLELVFRQGGELNISTGIVVTANGPLTAKPFQIFTGAGTVSFGVGSVGEVYPQWWGIDGAADEVQINLAIDAIATSKSKVVFIGAFTTAAEIEADVADISLEGSGLSTITVAGAINGINVTADDVAIRGLKVVGDDTNGSLGIRTVGNRTIIEDNTVNDFDQGINAFGFGGAVGEGDNAIIRNNRVTQTTIQASGAPIGILANDSTGTLIEGNTVTMGVYSSGTVFPVGIHAGNVLAATVYNKIIGNTVYDGFDNIQLRGVRSVVMGNTLDGGFEAGIMADSDSAEHTIIGNIFKDCGRWGVSGNVGANGYGLLISNNVFKDCGTTAVGTEAAIAIFTGANSNIVHISVIGNYIEGGKTGIYVQNNATFAVENISIIGNSLADQTVEGIQISRGDNVSVIGNNIHNATTYGINLTGNTTATNLVVMGNILNGNGTNLRTDGVFTETRILDNEGADETITADAQTLQPWGYSLLNSNAQKVDSTLGSGYYIGQIKTIAMTEASNSSTVSVTNHETSDPEVFTFAQVDDTLVLMWTGTEWITVANSGAAT